MAENPFEPFLQQGENVDEMAATYTTLLARNSPTPLYLSLPEKEQSLAKSIAERSVVRTYTDAINFGMDAQENVKGFANLLFSQMKKADSEKINRILHSLVDQLQQIDPEQLLPAQKGFFRRLLPKRSPASIQQTVSNYKRLSKYVDRLAIELSHAKQDLQREHERLNNIYEKNKEHFMQLNVFIAAIELKLQELRDVTYPQLKQDIQVRDNMFEEMSVRDLEQAIEWLDRRKYDLQISREITLQAAPQIRMTQITNEMLMDKIQGSILTTFPLWQTQIATILSIGHQTRLQQTEARLEKVNEQMVETNVKNVQFVSQEQQIETFKETQSSLVETIYETLANSAEERNDILEQQPKKTHRYNPNK